MDDLEARIGYQFSNASLLREALTHPSLAYETKQHHFDNQRLEYLGDAEAYRRMASIPSPFGDGEAAERIAEAIARWLEGQTPLLPPDREFG